MANKQSKNENKNNVINTGNRHYDYLLSRFKRILNNGNMDDTVADMMVAAIEEWRKDFKKQQIKRIDEQIAKLTAMKEALA